MSMTQIYYDEAKRSRPDIFWGEIAACQHLVQIYQDEGVFMDSLEGFVAGGLKRRDGVIVIMTVAHRTALEERLRERGISLSIAQASGQYIPLDAKEMLTTFLVKGWPEQELFEQVITELLVRARGEERRRVRAFGEMVAVMWGQGLSGATVRLEYLWHQFCAKEAFSLFCAYPRSGFTEDAEVSMKEICATHSQVIAGEALN